MKVCSECVGCDLAKSFVCGANSLTYLNACFAACNKTTVDFDGFCTDEEKTLCEDKETYHNQVCLETAKTMNKCLAEYLCLKF